MIKNEGEQREAAGRLLAAEAELLQTCGWIPYVQDGKVHWKEPWGGQPKTQAEAIEAVKRKMNIP